MPLSSPVIAANPQDALRILQHLDAGLTSVNSWLRELHCTLICCDLSESENLASDPTRSNFSLWFHDEATPELKQNKMFQKAGKIHKTMHEIGNSLLQKKLNQHPVLTKEYDSFIALTTEFIDELRTLQFHIINTACVVDPLTGAWNRHTMHTQLAQELERMIRQKNSCSICMVDIDYFKQVNDKLGHVTGDQVLQAVVQFITKQLRKYDSIFRYGGEEFLLCLPNTIESQTEKILNRLRSNLEKFAIPLRDGNTISVTASFGISAMNTNISIEETINMADHALLSAKASGRNCVCRWQA